MPGNDTRTVEQLNAEEPLLQNEERDLIPIKYPDLWALVKKLEDMRWNFERGVAALPKDIEDLEKKCTPDQREYAYKTIAAFNGLDAEVVEGDTKLSVLFKIPELKRFEILKCDNEWIHNEVYGSIIIYYVKDKKQRKELLNACRNWPFLARKIAWARKWHAGNVTLGQKLVSSVITEGLGFMPSFLAVFYFKYKGLLQGLAQYNEWISRDEAMHAMVYIYLHKYYIKHKVDVNTIHEMFIEAVEIELAFADHVLPTPLPGIDAEGLKQYIKFYADLLMELLDVPKIYNVTNPFPFMAQQGLDGKANFFEREVTDYGRGLNAEAEQKEKHLDFTLENLDYTLGGF